jgi:hypothetical protein
LGLASQVDPRERVLEVDRETFTDAFGHGPVGIRHSLVGHPLLTLEALAELADALPSKDVERHRADLPLLSPGGAPDLEGPPSETVLGIESNGRWMVLWYLEQVPAYRALLDACLEDIEGYIAGVEGGMSPRRREAFLFLSAPDALTPVHFDPEHNLLLQIKGTKDMHVCRFADEAAAQAELIRYHDGGHRNLDAMPTGEETTFRLRPGDGVYVPAFMPHWVQNGQEASISLSITFRSRVSEQAERVHRLNAHLRRLKLAPRPPGASARADQAKEMAYVALRAGTDQIGRARRLLGGRRSSPA